MPPVPDSIPTRLQSFYCKQREQQRSTQLSTKRRRARPHRLLGCKVHSSWSRRSDDKNLEGWASWNKGQGSRWGMQPIQANNISRSNRPQRLHWPGMPSWLFFDSQQLLQEVELGSRGHVGWQLKTSVMDWLGKCSEGIRRTSEASGSNTNDKYLDRQKLTQRTILYCLPKMLERTNHRPWEAAYIFF